MSQILKGRLLKWDSQKGFGFIQPENNSENIFIHISDFKDKGYSPIIGEILIYQIGIGKENKKKAIYAYPEKKQLNHIGNRNVKKNFTKKRSLSGKIILLVLLGAVGILSGFFQKSKSRAPIEYREQEVYSGIEDEESIAEFLKKEDKFLEAHTKKKIVHSEIEKDRGRCDGRKYCSQMKSCDEAKYFLAHCPDPRMDGDGDGIPCEGQWCGH